MEVSTKQISKMTGMEVMIEHKLMGECLAGMDLINGQNVRLSGNGGEERYMELCGVIFTAARKGTNLMGAV